MLVLVWSVNRGRMSSTNAYDKSEPDEIPSVLDERVVMTGVGLSTVYDHPHQFIVDLWQVNGDRTQRRTRGGDVQIRQTAALTVRVRLGGGLLTPGHTLCGVRLHV